MELENRFARPDDQVIEDLVARCLPQPVEDFEQVETGSSALVVLTQDAAVRIARDPRACAEMVRTQALVDRLPPLP
ncbi:MULTISPECIES: hypothetical protein [unclassified Luteococcus]|uniref:hypothetical protein n=1 Tax=unclassified Luteococcus TaxID=2639923 RepID=UPI00313EEA58